MIRTRACGPCRVGSSRRTSPWKKRQRASWKKRRGSRTRSFEQLAAFGDPGRDPRGHTVSVAFLTFVNADRAVLKAGDDASAAQWFPLADLALTPPKTTAAKTPAPTTRRKPPAKLPLAFDHAKIIVRARARLQDRLLDPTRGPAYQLVPSRFTLTELQHVYQAVLGRPLDQRAFRKQVLAGGVVAPVALRSTSAKNKQLYRWSTSKTKSASRS